MRQTLAERFNRQQGIYEMRVPDAPREVPPPRPQCAHIQVNTIQCRHLAQPGGTLCGVHNRMLIRRRQNEVVLPILAEARRRVWREGHGIALIAAWLEIRTEGIHDADTLERIRREVSDIQLRPKMDDLAHLARRGATLAEMHAQIGLWAHRFEITDNQRDRLILIANNLHIHEEWRRNIPANLGINAPRPVQRFGPEHREAQLAADSQNVHTSEIAAQMNASLAMLVAVDVPETQTSTMAEILHTWSRQGHPPAEIQTVYNDAVDWWNRRTMFSPGDKLYKKCMRGLWWTIKQYTGDTRTELEKRLWQECRDAAIPYSVCVQGHMARLSNVMVGFDEAFVPPVPVGEILQQKMAAIYEMDIGHAEQIAKAQGVLDELKIPIDQHQNWLSAF